MSMTRKWPRGFYVYLLCYPDETPYYVGMGKGSRAGNPYRNKWAMSVRKKIESGNQEIITKITEVDSRESAIQLEIELISKYGRRDIGTGILTNLTNGGEGGNGSVWTTDMRQNLRAKKLGTKMSDKTRALMSERLKGNQHMKGHVHSEETRKKISEAGIRRGSTLTDEGRVSISRSISERNKLDPPRKGRKNTPEHNRKVIESRKRNTELRKLNNAN